MTVRHVIHTPATREGLTRAIEHAQHLRPILEAVRDAGCGMLFVGQSADPFRLPCDPVRPVIVIIGDDFDRAVGPAGFHMPSLRRAIQACTAFAVISSEPQPAIYGSIAITAALSRENVLIVETRPAEEIPWVSLIQKTAPGRFLWLGTVEGGHA